MQNENLFFFSLYSAMALYDVIHNYATDVKKALV